MYNSALFSLRFKPDKWLDVPNSSCWFGSICMSNYICYSFMQCHIHLKYVLCIFPVAVAVAAHLDAIDFICYGLFLIHRIRNGYIVVGVIVLWTTQKEEQNKANDATRIENVFFSLFCNFNFCIRISFLTSLISPLSSGSESTKHNAINEVHREEKTAAKWGKNEEDKENPSGRWFWWNFYAMFLNYWLLRIYVLLSMPFYSRPVGRAK